MAPAPAGSYIAPHRPRDGMDDAFLTTRRGRIATTVLLGWLAAIVVVVTAAFQPTPDRYVTEQSCAPGDACPEDTACFATADGGRCVEPGYVGASCAWYETAAVAESYPQQVVCSTDPGRAVLKIVLAPVFALAQVAYL